MKKVFFLSFIRFVMLSFGVSSLSFLQHLRLACFFSLQFGQKLNERQKQKYRILFGYNTPAQPAKGEVNDKKRNSTRRRRRKTPNSMTPSNSAVGGGGSELCCFSQNTSPHQTTTITTRFSTKEGKYSETLLQIAMSVFL